MTSAEPVQRPDGMVWIPGGQFTMGSDGHYPEEAPAHPVSAGGFWIDSHPVTNAEFGAFVEATGYQTAAEWPADPSVYPGADPAMLAPGSAMFTPPSRAVDLRTRISGGRTFRGRAGGTRGGRARRCGTCLIIR